MWYFNLPEGNVSSITQLTFVSVVPWICFADATGCNRFWDTWLSVWTLEGTLLATWTSLLLCRNLHVVTTCYCVVLLTSEFSVVKHAVRFQHQVDNIKRDKLLSIPVNLCMVRSTTARLLYTMATNHKHMQDAHQISFWHRQVCTAGWVQVAQS